ncbi:aspartic proteinase nepenthesin-1-like [Salvia divinorum]|uniref:Aspartic proteinase nepenthesin-1-like n=1 Tax=Salvia divinorum TaxID=28513 RepID=A0ABD1GPK6_SALDI
MLKLKIVSRLSGNELHLPDSFGSYKLSEWSMEPRPPQIEVAWWQQHHLALVIPSVAVVVIGICGGGTAFPSRPLTC